MAVPAYDSSPPWSKELAQSDLDKNMWKEPMEIFESYAGWPREMKIMIVDDSEPVRRMIASFLDDLVDVFVECDDGSNALSTYLEHRPDLVLMDIKMKLLDGFVALMEIKKVCPEAHVLMVSQW